MDVQLNHHIVLATDPDASAAFLADVLGLDTPQHAPPFVEVRTANGVSLDFMANGPGEVLGQHYAFLVSETDFDEIWGRIRERGLDFYADPHAQHRGEINHHDGGRGLYWSDPDGHWLEIITRPYGG